MDVDCDDLALARAALRYSCECYATTPGEKPLGLPVAWAREAFENSYAGTRVVVGRGDPNEVDVPSLDPPTAGPVAGAASRWGRAGDLFVAVRGTSTPTELALDANARLVPWTLDASASARARAAAPLLVHAGFQVAAARSDPPGLVSANGRRRSAGLSTNRRLRLG